MAGGCVLFISCLLLLTPSSCPLHSSSLSSFLYSFLLLVDGMRTGQTPFCCFRLSQIWLYLVPGRNKMVSTSGRTMIVILGSWWTIWSAKKAAWKYFFRRVHSIIPSLSLAGFLPSFLLVFFPSWLLPSWFHLWGLPGSCAVTPTTRCHLATEPLEPGLPSRISLSYVQRVSKAPSPTPSPFPMILWWTWDT